MILDSTGELVWSEYFGNEFGGQAYNLAVQEYRSDNYLTFWLGDDRIRGHGFGQFLMLNSSYDVVRRVGGGTGAPVDLHEFLLTPQGTALVIIYETTVGDLSAFGPRIHSTLFGVSYIWDNIIREIDIESNEVIFEWRASDHVNVTNTYRNLLAMGTQQDPFDWFHANSIDKDELGNYLVCARYTHAIYYIDGRTKDILWILGGKANSFMDSSEGSALNFAWQHDARFISEKAFPETYAAPRARRGHTTKLLTLFDNAAEDWNYEYGPARSRGMLLQLTYPTPGKPPKTDPIQHGSMTPNGVVPTTLSPVDAQKVTIINGSDSSYVVRLIRDYIPPDSIRSSSQGNLQVLQTSKGKDSRVLVGFGLAAVVTEFSGNGAELCNVHFGPNTSWESGDVQSYRAYKYHWIGRPRTAPAVVVRGQILYVSWNGATEVRLWKIQSSDSLDDERGWVDVSTTKKEGFETAVVLPDSSRTARYLRVTAIDAKGKQCAHGMKDVDRGRLATMVRQHISDKRAAHAGVLLIIGAGISAVCGTYVLCRLILRRRSDWLSSWKLVPPSHTKQV